MGYQIEESELFDARGLAAVGERVTVAGQAEQHGPFLVAVREYLSQCAGHGPEARFQPIPVAPSSSSSSRRRPASQSLHAKCTTSIRAVTPKA